MSSGPVEVLTAARLPELIGLACGRVGVPSPGPGERFVFRTTAGALDLVSKLLQEVFPQDAAEVAAGPASGPGGPGGLPAGPVAVREGFDEPCPCPERLRQAAGGRGLLFAVERRGGGGELLGVAWVALADEPPDPEAPLRAAVFRQGAP